MKSDQTAWFDANVIAILLAINPRGLKGVTVKSQFGPVRDAWLTYVRQLASSCSTQILKAPANISAEQLLGSLDIEASLQAGSLIMSKGLLERVQGNLLLLPMVERMDLQAIALISQALDETNPADTASPFGVIALDESDSADEAISPRLLDRLAFEIYLDQFSIADIKESLEVDAEDVAEAKKLLPLVKCSDEYLEVMTKAGFSLGVISLRANQFALETAKTLAALRGLSEVGQDEVIDAARLVYTPSKRIQIPSEPDQADQGDQDDQNSDSQMDDAQDEPDTSPEQNQEQPSNEELEDIIVEAVKASIPPQLLRQPKQSNRPGKSAAHISGKSGAVQKNFLSGRPLSSRKGRPSDGKRLDILKSIRAAIPWQRLRGASILSQQQHPSKSRIDFRAEDLHIKQYLRRRGTVTIFLVDASGSSATQRLSEAKGALEELLAQCYIRRDEVAMVSMRGAKAEIVLPPTRSLARAKRNLAALPGGGGTPLAAGFRAANEMAISLERKGLTPVIVIMSDGKANVNLNGVGGRAGAHSDALMAAKELRVKNHRLLFVDTSPQPELLAQELSSAMAAQYFPLPFTSSGKKISQAAMHLAND
ncbi:magnesium chelatase subunit D [Polynucleobacter sp. AP-Titi-500A-B4]|uniref:magnesium chelatase subunit D n=1 Tax=Polynucleobacter sp. AP-Titi-500A-B4 TaxID=2576923 RepID=UPI001BFD58E3|nr:magnesium chelatase subunit D [Polynucleobacter sp. AP-Titi-500A-B4]QWE12100.1 magnesium chelatase subunit D [Polynucleobacter sp. AP-Titi-500A-B4]